MTRRIVLALTVSAAVLTGCSHVAGYDPSEPPRGSAPPARVIPVATVPTVLILDASGSMTETDAPGPRIDAAKTAASTLVDALPDGAMIGLTTYGTGTGNSEAEKAAGCGDVTPLIPLDRLDRDEMRSRIDGLRPSGWTPIGLALNMAVAQLPADGLPQAIVLVSDGEDTCGAPPCDAATQAKRAHPGLSISTIGFKTTGAATDQLACIAAVTGGLFVQADNANQLTARLLATQNISEAEKSLSSDGLGDIQLGATPDDIRSRHKDFPETATTGTVTVVYRDCDWTFVDGVLDSIARCGRESGRPAVETVLEDLHQRRFDRDPAVPSAFPNVDDGTVVSPAKVADVGAP